MVTSRSHRRGAALTSRARITATPGEPEVRQSSDHVQMGLFAVECGSYAETAVGEVACGEQAAHTRAATRCAQSFGMSRPAIR